MSVCCQYLDLKVKLLKINTNQVTVVVFFLITGHKSGEGVIIGDESYYKGDQNLCAIKLPF